MCSLAMYHVCDEFTGAFRRIHDLSAESLGQKLSSCNGKIVAVIDDFIFA